MQHLTMDQKNLCLKLIITDTHIILQNNYLVSKEKLVYLDQEVIDYSKYFSSNFIELLGYETRDKLIWTSGEGCRNTNTIGNQRILNSNINMTSNSSTLGFGCYPHNDT